MSGRTSFLPAPARRAVEAARAAYAAEGRFRLPGFLAPAAARTLHRFLAEEAEWWRTFNQGERIWDLGPLSIEALTPDKAAALDTAIHGGARGGFQYVYETVRVSEDAAERGARALPVDRLLQAFNSPAGLAFWRALTGAEDIALVDGQATRYLPGHFLTRHDDDVAGKNRVAAYVLNLNPEWRPEWGGLLLFHDEAGDVTRGYVPGFNSLHVFRVPQPHSVSMVAPFAGAPRYAVTGWVRRAG